MLCYDQLKSNWPNSVFIKMAPAPSKHIRCPLSTSDASQSLTCCKSHYRGMNYGKPPKQISIFHACPDEKLIWSELVFHQKRITCIDLKITQENRSRYPEYIFKCRRNLSHQFEEIGRLTKNGKLHFQFLTIRGMGQLLAWEVPMFKGFL